MIHILSTVRENDLAKHGEMITGRGLAEWLADCRLHAFLTSDAPDKIEIPHFIFSEARTLARDGEVHVEYGGATTPEDE